MSKKNTPIHDRLNGKLTPKEIGKIRPALLQYLDSKNIEPSKVKCNMEFIRDFMPELIDFDSSWEGIFQENIKSTHEIIKQLKDLTSSYFVSHHKLVIDLKDIRETRILAEIDEKLEEDLQ